MRPTPLPLPDRPPTAEVLRRVDEALRAGGLVAFPTETVYGLAARADDPRALEALRRLKGRDAERPLTWHVGRREVLRSFESLRPLIDRVAERYWPGPLTLVLEGVPEGLEGVARAGWTGVRYPAHAGTAGLLAALPYPVAMTSANLSGAAPALDLDPLLAEFGADLALVLDGGPARLGEASGVLALGRGRFELLREGLLPLSDLRRTAGLGLAFVCTGNTCRSPMAEGLARNLLAERLGLTGAERETFAGQVRGLARFGFEVASMGVSAGPGYPASPEAVQVLGSQGIDLTRHASRLALADEVASYDRVYCLTRGHLEALRAILPPGKTGPLELLDPDGRDVADPIGAPLEVYRATAEQMRGMLEQRLDSWA